jgi:hypothetical protein
VKSVREGKHFTTVSAGQFVQKDDPALVMEALEWVKERQKPWQISEQEIISVGQTTLSVIKIPHSSDKKFCFYSCLLPSYYKQIKPKCIMKKIIFTCSLMVLNLVAFSQETKTSQTLLSTEVDEIGWFVELPFTLSEIQDETIFLPGLSAGVILNQNLRLGLSGFDFSQDWNRISLPEADQGKGAFLEGSYGGLLIEPLINSEKLIHFTFPLLIGGGRVELESKTLHPDEDGEMEEMELAEKAYFMLRPGANVEFNLHPYVRLAVGASYRWTTNIDMPDVEKDAMRGFNAHFSVRVGQF